MTQSLRKQEIVSRDVFREQISSPFNLRHYKAPVLDFLFRNIAFTTVKENIRTLTLVEYWSIGEALSMPITIIHKIISRFLVDLIYFRKFLSLGNLNLGVKNTRRKIQIYLHKIHKMAPVFDYKRASKNSDILKRKLDSLFFWPRVTTQIAIIIFATDLLKEKKSSPIIQSNLRSLCSCSAYAFHRTRNKIGLNPYTE
ncbi:MAG: hypothetical protein ACW986_03695 [Promethearchaeota archaeon]|jgi:hypothetical protein